MASVRKRVYKDGTTKFIVDFKDDRGIRCHKTFDHKKTATAFRDNIVVEVQGGKYLPRRDEITFKQALDSWLCECNKRVLRGHLTRGTLAAYECNIARTVDFFGKMKLAAITTAHVQDMIDTLLRTLSPQTIGHTVNQLGAVCQAAIEGGHLKVSPVDYRKLNLPRAERSVQIPPKDALRAIMAAITGGRGRYEQHSAYPNRAVIVTLALFGTLRRGEIVALKWKDIDFRTQIIRVQRSRSYHDGEKSTKTKAGVRSFAMAPPVLDALTALFEARQGVHVGPEDYVLLTTKGRPFNCTTIYGDHWRPVLIKAGIIKEKERSPFRFHGLRHAAASLLIEQGVSPMHVKTMMGHASVKTTIDTYGHLFPTDQTLRIASVNIAADLAATHKQHDPLSS